MRSSAWVQLNASDAPTHRYRQSLVLHASEGALYLFGGESYKPYMYHNSVSRLQLPRALAAETIAAFGGGGGSASGATLAAPHRTDSPRSAFPSARPAPLDDGDVKALVEQVRLLGPASLLQLGLSGLVLLCAICCLVVCLIKRMESRRPVKLYRPVPLDQFRR